MRDALPTTGVQLAVLISEKRRTDADKGRTPDNRGGGPIANPDQILGKNPRRSDFFRTKFDFLAKNV
jgi:hypothetical protein